MKNGKSNNNNVCKKGNFFKYNWSIYMLIDFIENEENQPLALLMRVKTKYGRFNIKHKRIVHKYWLTESIENVSVDSRDTDIFNEFVDYVNSTEFKIVRGTSWKPHHCFIDCNFSKFKKYSNNI